jgi:hypothetical protein
LPSVNSRNRSADLQNVGTMVISPFSFFLYPRFPATLPGQHAVGTVRARLPGSTHVQVLYPCGKGGKRTSYFRSATVESLAGMSGLPTCLFRHLDRGPRSHPSLLEAPVLQPPATTPDGWPIVIFSHGTWGCEDMYTSLCRSIASFGFVVVALEHEDGSGCHASSRDGRTIAFSLPKGPGADYRPLLTQRLDELAGALVALSRDGPALERSVDLVLASCDRSAFILAGHSFGGATCALASQQLSTRFKLHCALLMDTWAGALHHSDYSKSRGVPLPFLSVESHMWSEKGWGISNLLVGGDERCALLYAPNTEHQSFSDSSLWTPSFLATRFGSLGKGEQRHQLHRAVAAAANTFVRSTLAAEPIKEPATLLEQAGAAAAEGVLLPRESWPKYEANV